MQRKSVLGQSRKRRHGEITCTCGAYSFPHRLFGGRCSGLGFVADFFDSNATGDCRDCSFLFIDFGYECEVCNGSEKPHKCPAFVEYLQRNEVSVPMRFDQNGW